MSKLKIFKTFLLCLSVAGSYAQKVGLAKESLYAPADIKIDGQLTEWGNKFQFNNDASRMWYTVSNDDKNLYLTFQGMGQFANEKIMEGGLIFTVRSAAVKTSKPKDQNDVVITSPMIDNEVDLKAIILASETYRHIRDDTIGNKQKIDSVHVVINKLAGRFFKEIKVIGIKEVPDSLISIYNETGIHAVASFDRKINYIFELAIPLKYLGNVINSAGKLRYNIKQPGPNMEAPAPAPGRMGAPVVMFASPGTGVFSAVPPLVAAGLVPGMGSPFDNYRFFLTDVWGDYTLAKK